MSEDYEWYKPVSQETIDTNLKKAEKKFKGFSDEQIKHLRIKAKNDLFFLSYSILGYDKLSGSLHKDLCGWNHQTDNEQFRCILLPRSHFKSTIETISDTVRIHLTDDLGTSPYPRNLGPNGRTLIAHEVLEQAAYFLYSITGHFTQNPVLMGLFPELVPNARVQRINKNELELPRDSIWNEPTIDTMGVGGRKQGRHYNYLKLDDIYGAEARDSEAVKKSTLLWFDNIQSFLITPLTDHFDLIGTRWGFDDVYEHAFRMYGEALLKYIRSCLEYGPHGKLEPIFPEHFTLKSIAILMKNRIIWNAQYANNPKENQAGFQESWLRYYNYTGQNTLTVFNGTESFQRDIRELDRIILVDPAMSGGTGFNVTGTDKRNNVFVLESEKQDWNPPQFIDKLFKAVIRWQPRIVVIEDVLFSGLYQHWLVTEMSVRGIKFKVEPCKTGNKSKSIRILGLSNYFEAGQMFFNQNQVDLREEYNMFGSIAPDKLHLLDSLAQGPKFWRAPVNVQSIEQKKQAEECLRTGTDPVTGYSSYD